MLTLRPTARAIVILVVMASVPSNAEHTADSTHNHAGKADPIGGSRDPCIVYVYDSNGNRLFQTITVSGGVMSPTWGTGVWGCFAWTP
jgi:hypothetical protein